MHDQPKPTYILTLRDCGRADDPPAERRMAQLLKQALRRFGFRCVRVSGDGQPGKGARQPHDPTWPRA